MVTHNWSNLFHHLVAGIFADALEKEYYAGVAKLCVNQLQLVSTCYGRYGFQPVWCQLQCNLPRLSGNLPRRRC